jgi:hypothetical protein
MTRLRPPHHRAGSALISTLLVIVVLSIIVVAFLQSMSIERQTARSYLNKYRAELAAQAGQSIATTQLCRLMAANPYHGIGYMYAPNTTAPTATSPLYTVLYGAPAGASPSPTPHYLLSIPSTGDPTQSTDDPSGKQLSNMDETNSISINRKSNNSDTSGWMGSPVDSSGAQTYRECRAPWIYILKDPASPHQPNPIASNYNPYIARYAFWVEDETSKLNLLTVGNSKGSGGAFQPPPPTNLADSSSTSYQDAIAWGPSNLDLGAIPIKEGQPIASSDGSSNKTLIDTLHPLASVLKDSRTLAQVPGFSTSESSARFYTTVNSVSDELNGAGRRRININALVHDTAVAPSIIASDIDDIAFAISGQHIIPNQNDRDSGGLFYSNPDNATDAPIPNFGERFWPASSGSLPSNLNTTLSKAQIYLLKISANIRDYIDSDSNPTFVDDSGKILAGSTAPSYKESDPDAGIFPNYNNADHPMPLAIGKEAIPYLTKNAFVTTFKNSTLGVDQFFSFFNPYTKDFVAPSGTYLRCFNRLKWKRGSLSSFQMPSFWLDLSGLTFPAGQTVVVTSSVGTNSAGAQTDPQSTSIYPDASVVPFSDAANVWRPGKKDGTITLMHPADACVHFEAGSNAFEPAVSTTTYDISTKFVWGNVNGYYGGFPAITLTQFNKFKSGNPYYLMMDSNNYRDRGNSILGNDHASRSGDGRSLDEPLVFNHNVGSTSLPDQHRFFDESPIDISTPKNSYIDPGKWPDYAPDLNNTATTSYAVVRDEPMTSIGELGYIYDPYRVKGAGSSNALAYARGGGRTLRVGQPDDVILSPTESNASQIKTFIKFAAQEPRFSSRWLQSAWRLTDVFDVILDPSGSSNSQGLVNRSTRLVPPQADGKVNINSALRDNGAVLRSLLRGFRYLGGQALSETDINTIITSLIQYLKDNGPMIERGELSQLLTASNDPLFANATLGGQPLSMAEDRIREEIFRRLIEMLTTRSNSFMVFSIGQSLREQANGTITPLSTATKATNYRFDPVISGRIGSAIPDQNPLDAATDFIPSPIYDRP